MSSQVSLILLATLLFSIACQYTAHCSEFNTTEAETKANFSGDHEGPETTVEPTHDYDNEDSEDEEMEEELSLLGYITDDSIRVQPVIKPDTSTKKEEKKKPEKNGDKKNANKKKKGKKNKKTPCDTTHKDFCVHGECKYLKNLKEVTCKCFQNYFGPRCSEKFMKTQTTEDLENVSTTALAVTAVLLSTISIVAIIIIIVVHTRRKYSTYECEAEEKKKLGQENGSEEIDV
ncbi:amphiregulin [Discoglossus pictus]